MVDRERVLSKIAELDGYLVELESLNPASFEEFRRPERKRACERLLQISIEMAISICHLLLSGLRLGIPSEQDDVFEKLSQATVISEPVRASLRRMKGFRNILVHEYGDVDDELVFEFLRTRLGDFAAFRGEVLSVLDPQA
jgi:uncharacterized protein YutE (UPF0331/DUF86 family)